MSGIFCLPLHLALCPTACGVDLGTGLLALWLLAGMTNAEPWQEMRGSEEMRSHYLFPWLLPAGSHQDDCVPQWQVTAPLQSFPKILSFQVLVVLHCVPADIDAISTVPQLLPMTQHSPFQCPSSLPHTFFQESCGVTSVPSRCLTDALLQALSSLNGFVHHKSRTLTLQQRRSMPRLLCLTKLYWIWLGKE